jgi:hypothetical protein
MPTHRIRGETIRWTFTDGPLAGKTVEHMFDPSGSVTWSMQGGKPSREHHYEVARCSDSVHLVSYLGTSGYTLTVALNFDDHSLVAFASNEKELVVQHGSFEVVETGQQPHTHA